MKCVRSVHPYLKETIWSEVKFFKLRDDKFIANFTECEIAIIIVKVGHEA
jgi:hypothetical protein